MRKWFVSPKVYGPALAEAIAQTMEAERPANSTYRLAVGPVEMMAGDQWDKVPEEKGFLSSREADIARARGWKAEPPAGPTEGDPRPPAEPTEGSSQLVKRFPPPSPNAQ